MSRKFLNIPWTEMAQNPSKWPNYDRNNLKMGQFRIILRHNSWSNLRKFEKYPDQLPCQFTTKMTENNTEWLHLLKSMFFRIAASCMCNWNRPTWVEPISSFRVASIILSSDKWMELQLIMPQTKQPNECCDYFIIKSGWQLQAETSKQMQIKSIADMWS